ncbi:MAG: hypothetical protein MUO67_24005, partial [Anaerolineales bacterium]|nr:hypothetical protein [Anaerolineales bacterium]
MKKKFLALLTCRLVGDLYLQQSQPKLARKFLEQSLAIAEEINNRPLAQSISGRLAHVPSSDVGKEHLLASLHGISEVLQNID